MSAGLRARHAVLVVSLSVLAVVADFALIVPALGQRWPNPFVLAMLGVIFSQISLVSIWVGLSRRRWPERVLGFVAGTAALHAMFWVWGKRTTLDELLPLAAVQAAVVTVPLLLARGLGIRLDQHPGGDAAAEREHSRQAVQVTIRDMLLMTVAAAVVLAILRSLPRASYGSTLRMSMLIGLDFALLALVAVWAAFGPARRIVRVTVLCLMAATSGVALYRILGGPRETLVPYAVLTGVQLAYLAGSLGAFRLLGYRFVWGRAGTASAWRAEGAQE